MSNSLATYTDYTNTGTMPVLLFSAPDDTYSGHIKAFVEYCEERGAVSVDEEIVADYFRDLNASSYAAGTIRIKRQAVKKRLRQLSRNWPTEMRNTLDRRLEDMDKFGDTRAPKIAKLKQRVGSDKIITAEERMQLINAATPRLAYQIEFMYLTGCRVQEMVTAKIGKCKRDADRVVITIIGKGNKERDLIITAEFYDSIRAFYRGEEYLFETQTGKPYAREYVGQQIRRLGKRVLGRQISSHTMRHSFATRKIKQTGNLKGVSEYLGHSSVAITADMYDHNMLADADLLEASIVEVAS